MLYIVYIVSVETVLCSCARSPRVEKLKESNTIYIHICPYLVCTYVGMYFVLCNSTNLEVIKVKFSTVVESKLTSRGQLITLPPILFYAFTPLQPLCIRSLGV
jgi:hypothetical protein